MPRRPLIVDSSLYDISKPIANLEKIRRYNPQRFEMEQLTGVLYENLENKAMVGYLKTSDRSFWVRGHMPDIPLMPGVVMCEAAAQLTAYAARRFELVPGTLLGLTGLDEVRFRGSVKPGDTVVVQASLLRGNAKLIVGEFVELVGNDVICEGIVKGTPIPV